MDNTYQVIFMPSGRRGQVAADESLLAAAQRLGVQIESICGGRLTCGKCKIRVEEGHFPKHAIRSEAAGLSVMNEAEQALLARLDSLDCRLACAAHINGNLLITVPEESQAHKQIIRKSATERAIEVKAAVRQVYVTVDPALLGDHRGDWGRLQDALAEQWQLADLTIDWPALRRLQSALRQGKWSATVTLWQDSQVIDVQPGYVEGVYGLAVDLGTTTIAAHLCDLRTGALLATESVMNPQVPYGEDLMSRISYAMSRVDGLATMQQAVIDALNRLAAQAARAAGLQAREIVEAVVVGNTTMMHILLGLDPTELGAAPFALATREAVDLKARELGLRLHQGANLHVLPAEAGHVGADNVAVLLAEAPHEQDELVLIVDIGTNGEIVLGRRDQLYSASSPTGPAFEGAQITYGMRAAPGAIERVRIDPVTKLARFKVIGEDRWSDQWSTDPTASLAEQSAYLAAGICGSGIIEAVVELFLAGIIGPDGRFKPDLTHERVLRQERYVAYVLATGEQTTSGEPILVTQLDVRNIQLAKAALYAGAKLLMMRAGVTHLDRVLLAGAFGSFIDPRSAMILGLIPDCDLSQVYAVGNAAGDGARIALLNLDRRREAPGLARRVRYIETAVDPDFQAEFVAAMHLPHQSDAFPHLDGLLPKDLSETNALRPRARLRYRP